MNLYFVPAWLGSLALMTGLLANTAASADLPPKVPTYALFFEDKDPNESHSLGDIPAVVIYWQAGTDGKKTLMSFGECSNFTGREHTTLKEFVSNCPVPETLWPKIWPGPLSGKHRIKFDRKSGVYTVTFYYDFSSLKDDPRTDYTIYQWKIEPDQSVREIRARELITYKTPGKPSVHKEATFSFLGATNTLIYQSGEPVQGVSE